MITCKPLLGRGTILPRAAGTLTVRPHAGCG